MQVRNNDKVSKYFFYKVNGQTKKVNIPGMTAVILLDLVSMTQVIRNGYDVKVAHINGLLNRHILGDFTVSTSLVASVIPTSSNATVQAWINKITSDGYTYPSQAKVDVYTTAFNYADSQGLTAKFDVVGLLKVENQNLCKIPFLHAKGNSARFTLVGSNLIFTPNVGIKSNAGDSYILTSFAESDGINYQLGNSSYGGYVASGYTPIANQDLMGTADDTLGTESIIMPRSIVNGFFGDIQSYGDLLPGTNPNDGSGLSSISLYQDVVNLYRNGVLNVTQDGSQDYQLSNYQFAVLGENFNDTGIDGTAYFRNDVSFFYMSSGDIDQVKLNAFVNMLLL